MPWRELSIVSERCEFVRFAMQEVSNIRELCRRYGISHQTAYKWIGRYSQEGQTGLSDRSRRPHQSPRRTAGELEQRILALRDRHPAWGGRKLRARLQTLKVADVPSASTITMILKRHQRLDPAESAKHQTWKRFEYPAPNELWQMDFKGDFPLSSQGRCYPLTILDDHSRFAIGLRACTNQQGPTVQQHLTELFERYGLPRRMLTDNGTPWGAQGQSRYTTLSVWLIRLGIRPLHSQPYHPQTLGKDERFHRTLQAEVIRYRDWRDVQQCQRAFDPWREAYNLERPHEALNMAVPATRYHPSPRSFPSALPAIEYGPGDIIRKVHCNGALSFQKRIWRIGEAFRGLPVAIRPAQADGVYKVWFCAEYLCELDLRSNQN